MKAGKNTLAKYAQFAYFEGKFVPYQKAKVSVLTHGFNYGTAVFGGIRGYWNNEKKQLFVFRPLDHFKRFLNSSRLLSMKIDHTAEELTQLTLELLRMEQYQQDIYIRPLAYKADEAIGVRLHDLQDRVSIVAIPFGKYIKNDTNAHVQISSWRRIDDNMIPARGKISGAYVNSAFIKTDAILAGFDEALVLTQEGHISEGSAMNVFMIKDGMVVTPPVTENILEGITRRSVITLINDQLQLKIIERPIDRTEIYLCEEFFMTGSAAQVTAVTRVDHREIGTGVMGPVTTQLRELFDSVIYGKMEEYLHWNTPVYV